MYNELLNDACINRFKETVADKRILIVGNAVSLFSSDTHGELIDSYDLVVRLGKGFPEEALNPYLGTRFDGWFFGPGRAMYNRQLPESVKWNIFTPSQLRIYDGGDTMVSNLDMYTGQFQVYRDFFMTGTSDSILKLNKKINGSQHKKSRCSQGVQAVEFFNRLGLKTTLIGFDFFGGEFIYNFDNSKHSHIPKVQPTTSWHCPLISQEYTTNPHGYSLDGLVTNEEKYMRSLDGVEILPMPPIDPEKAEWLAKRLRGDNSTMKKD